MTDFKKVTLALAAVGLLSSGAAQAALHDRGGGLIYDDVLDITWLADANYAQTSGYDSDGRMDWNTATAWAAGLSYGGYDDWRLPDVHPMLIHMFFNNLGATIGTSILSGTNTANLALFTNLQSYFYWTDHVVVPDEPGREGSALLFNTQDGGDYFDLGMSFEAYAWAVRPGDVAAIPEPETYAMLLAGLGLLGGVAKWRRRSSGAS